MSDLESSSWLGLHAAAKKTRKKFRKHRTRKGKKIPLRKGKVIERRTRLLDTKPERSKITLRGRIKQITPKRKPVRRKPVRRKPVRRKPVRRPTPRKPIKRRTAKRRR